ncbi:hypothetical protein A4X06_0g6728 [Tilletia controversa]|uniref:Uncharacterized protein n=1 Tax=Tilletia controversa TaxID=13291 RepID=A0A8X7SUW1_9BASI|nr:hypothetical protein A4X06_0g6728 [Tilletia controversa]
MSPQPTHPTGTGPGTGPRDPDSALDVYYHQRLPQNVMATRTAHAQAMLADAQGRRYSPSPAPSPSPSPRMHTSVSALMQHHQAPVTHAHRYQPESPIMANSPPLGGPGRHTPSPAPGYQYYGQIVDGRYIPNGATHHTAQHREMAPPPPPSPIMASPGYGLGSEASATFVPTAARTTAKSGSSVPATPAVRRVPVPTDKTIVKKYLSEREVQTQVAIQVKKWVGASMSAVADDLTALVRNRIDLGMETYSMAVEAFKAQVLRVDGTENLERSDDGNMYLRVNHAELVKWFGALASLDSAVNTRLDQLADEMAALKLQMQEPVAAPIPAFTFSAGAAAVAESKNHRWTKVQAAFRTMIFTQAGIPPGRGSSDSETKIYELPYPASPQEITYHPVAYVPTCAEAPAPESSGAEGGPRYRQLRLKLDLGYNETPNKEILAPILTVLVRDYEKYGLPAGTTIDWLMDHPLKRTWVYWKDRFRQLQSGPSTAEVKQAWTQVNTDARRAKRLSAKGSRRYKALCAQIKASGSKDSKDWDIQQSVLFCDYYQSGEETVYEEDEDADCAPVKIKERVRKSPEGRSDQATKTLRSLDPPPNPKVRIVDSDDTASTELVLPLKFRNWMVRSDYWEDHPEYAGLLQANEGPFTGEFSVASSPEMLGSAPVPKADSIPSSASSFAFAIGGPSTALQQLFGNDYNGAPGGLDNEEGPLAVVEGGVDGAVGLGGDAEPMDYAGGAGLGGNAEPMDYAE